MANRQLYLSRLIDGYTLFNSTGKSEERGAKPRIGALRPVQQNAPGVTGCNLLIVKGKCCSGGQLRNG